LNFHRAAIVFCSLLKLKEVEEMKRGVMVWRYLAVGLVVCGVFAMGGAVTAQSQTLVLEDFQGKDAEGFPLNWEHENQRSQSRQRMV
jgi:hypothetical protein